MSIADDAISLLELNNEHVDALVDATRSVVRLVGVFTDVRHHLRQPALQH